MAAQKPGTGPCRRRKRTDGAFTCKGGQQMKKRLIALLLTLAVLLSAAACKPATSVLQEPETAPDSAPAEQESQM